MRTQTVTLSAASDRPGTLDTALAPTARPTKRIAGSEIEGEIEGEMGAPPPKRRSSVQPEQLAVPVLQAKLKLKLGNEYKKIVGATKKKPELLALYMQYCT